MTRFIWAILILAIIACNNNRSIDKATITKEVEHITPTKDQLERRLRSEGYCKSRYIPVYQNPNALFVEAEEKVTLRTTDEVVDRAIALCYLELKSEEADTKMLTDFEKRYDVMAKLAIAEKLFALATNPTKQQMIDANWRAESFHVMLWALGYIDNLDYPNKVCIVAEDVKHLFSKTEAEFRTKAKLRTKAEILDQADFILRLHWACVEEDQHPVARPSKEMLELDRSVIYERHYSLNWLINYLNQDWDDVTTDT